MSDGSAARDADGAARTDADRESVVPDSADPRARLAAIRQDPTRRRVALVVAAVLGLVAAWLHWLGLFLAGALVGLVSETLPRALAAGLGIGVLVLVVHVLANPAMSVGEFLALSPVSYVTAAAALVAPVWGSLVRGVV